jgi:hypothetical protein
MASRRGESGRRKLEKAARRILRGLKVGVLPDLMREVIDAESRSTADEIATAYLLALARRHTAAELANAFLEPETARWLARRILNHQRRLDGARPLPEFPGQEDVAAIAAIAAAPARPPALPPAG